jgi:hypothetical protein
VEASRQAWLHHIGCETDEAMVRYALQTRNPWVIKKCLPLLKQPELRTPATTAAVRAVAEDTQLAPWLRRFAIAAYCGMEDEHMAETLAALSTDTAAACCPYKELAYDTTRGFYGYESALLVRLLHMDAEEPNETVGKYAQEWLDALNGKH